MLYDSSRAAQFERYEEQFGDVEDRFAKPGVKSFSEKRKDRRRTHNLGFAVSEPITDSEPIPNVTEVDSVIEEYSDEKAKEVLQEIGEAALSSDELLIRLLADTSR